ncbi:MAG: hypothetical protein Q8P77_04165 [Candidatus Veblenbacteria bacterium]|nr:hypothetical protein [Candidatus Veblenbacteria bacterium]
MPKLAPPALKLTSKTRAGVSRLAHELYARQPTVAVVVASGTSLPPRFALLQGTAVPYSFAEWGDVATAGTVSIATGFTHQLKERGEIKFPMQLVSMPTLPYSFAVPVVLLSLVFPRLPFVFYHLPSAPQLDELGQAALLLSEQCEASTERVLVLASGTLAQVGPHDQGEAQVYNQYFRQALSSGDRSALVNLDPKLRAKARESLWAPVTLAWLALGERQVAPTMVSYESPARVGYLVAQLDSV